MRVLSSGRVRLGMALLGLSSLITGLDFTIVYVALPDIQRDLALTDAEVSWVITAYALAFGGFLLLFGRLSDRLGTRRVFVLGMALFLIGSLAGTVASGPGMLLAGRAVQGLGAAALFPSTLALVGLTFTAGRRRDRAMTIWAASGASGLSLGALLGGVLTELSWRGVFVVNVPLAAVAIGGAFVLLPADAARAVTGRFDVPGAVTGTAAAALLVLTITQATQRDTSGALVVVLAVLAATAALLFLRVESTGPDPLIPAALFSHLRLRASVALIASYGLGLQSIPYVLTLHLRTDLGLTALLTGLAFLVPTGAITVGNLAGEHLMRRFGHRAVLSAGLVIGSAGSALMAAVIGSGYLALVPGTLIAGCGMGLVFPAMFAAATTRLPAEHQGIVSAIASTALQIGTSIGVATVTAIIAIGPSGTAVTLLVIAAITLTGIVPARLTPRAARS